LLKEAIFHRSESSWAYPIAKEQIRVTLRTGKYDAVRCSVIARERYDIQLQEFVTPMERVGSDQFFTYWSADIGFPTRRIMYYFAIEGSDGGTIWYGEQGVSSNPGEAGWFQFPMITSGDTLIVPEWARGAVAYQIFPDRFANGDPANDPAHVSPWEVNPPKELVAYPYTSFGGDLKGITAKLPYLADLGVELIYLTPIFESPSAHKYDIRDYYKIDPQFGTMEDLRCLVDGAHARGIRIILDGVFNHCGFEFGPFQDVVANGPSSPYWDWFHVHGYPIVTEPVPNYEAWAFTPLVPRLNTTNPEVVKYFTAVGLYWLREAGIDGWRLDTANECDPNFWRFFRRAIKKEFPDAILMGEVWHDANRWLGGDQFDCVMNYVFRDSVLDFFAKRTIDAVEFDGRVTRMLVMYRRQAQEVNLNLLGSHDTGRFLGFCQDRKELLKLAVAFQMTFLGMPLIYYGDEIGMTSDGGLEDGRAPMIWDEAAQDKELRRYVAQLVKLRRQSPVLRIGEFRTLLAGSCTNTYAFARYLDDRIMVVVLNNSGEDVDVAIDLTAVSRHCQGIEVSFLELLTGAHRTTVQSHLQVRVEQYGVQIWSNHS